MRRKVLILSLKMLHLQAEPEPGSGGIQEQELASAWLQ